MSLMSAFTETTKNQVMNNTWGHMFPKPSHKYKGYMVISIGCYGDQTIIESEFNLLESSPQRYNLEHTIFQEFKFEEGVYRIDCTLWFFKNCRDMWTSEKSIGKIIKTSIKKIVSQGVAITHFH